MSTMKEKTDIISQLFDNYAQSVPPQVHLTKKAHDLVPSVHIKTEKEQSLLLLYAVFFFA